MSKKLYADSHEWFEILEDGTAHIGISDHAQNELGDIVYITLPEIDTKLQKGESFCEVESVKSVSDVFSPINGVVIAINEDLEDNPERVNEAANDTWLVQVANFSDYEDLMSEEDYLKTL